MLEGEKICFLKTLLYSHNLLANINKFEKYTLCGGRGGWGYMGILYFALNFSKVAL